MLAARLRKRMRHLSKWARKRDTTCFRLYERDIPEYPAIIDWYGDESAADLAHDGDAVAWLYDRTKDETPEAAATHLAHVTEEILDGLGIPADRLHIKHRDRQRADSGGRKQYPQQPREGQTKIVREDDLRFEVNLSDYIDVGLFLDHRPLRNSLRERCAGKRVLNLFAYTGTFSVYARAGGAASTDTLDLSKTYLEWYERNLRLNGFQLDASHRMHHVDCLQWLHAGPATEGERFDIVIADPPTFSNSKRMKADSFAVERDHAALLGWIAPFVAPEGEIFFSTNARRFDLDPAAVPAGFGCHEITHRTVPEDFRNKTIHRCWRLAEGWTANA